MKIDINDNTALTLGVLFLFLCIYGVTTQIVACNTSSDAAEKSCLVAGGDPYKCCAEFNHTVSCSHLKTKKAEAE